MSSAASAAKPSAYAASALRLGAPASRRMTRSAGTFLSCSSGGSAKLRSSTSPTRKPCSAGHGVASGSSARITRASATPTPACAT